MNSPRMINDSINNPPEPIFVVIVVEVCPCVIGEVVEGIVVIVGVLVVDSVVGSSHVRSI